MPASPDEGNLKYGWLAKAKLEEERARMQKFEEDKAKKEKDKSHPPWPPEAWHAAREQAMLGVPEAEKRFPVIIASSTGPFTTPEKLQKVADLSSVPEVKQTILTSILEEKSKELEKKEVQYCDVNWKQLVRVYDYSEGEDVVVWFQGKKRFA